MNITKRIAKTSLTLGTVLKITVLLVLLTLIGTAVAEAAVSLNPDVEIPGMDESTRKTALREDITAGVYSKFLGPAWSFWFGDNTILGGVGQYSGLFLAICKALNIVGLSIIGIMTLYSMYMYSLQSARTGEAGGKKMGAAFITMRTAFSAGFGAPIIHGLSAMQYIVIFAIGYSLIFANFIWKTGAEYIVENIESPIMDTAPPLVDSEALAAPVPLFQAVLIQEVMKDMDAFPNENIKEQALPPKMSSSDYLYDPYMYGMMMAEDRHETKIYGDWVVEHRPDAGKMILYPMPPRGMSLGGLGGVVVPCPVLPSKANSDDMEIYRAKLAVAQARIKAFQEMGEALRPIARQYRAQYQENAPFQDVDALSIINDYRKKVIDAAAPLVASLKASNKSVSHKLRRAFGMGASGEPSGGWITSAIAPALTAIASNQADILHYGGGVTFVMYDERAPSSKEYGNFWNATMSLFGYEQLPILYARDRMLLERAPDYAAQVLMKGRAWSGLDAKGDPAGNFNQLITKTFYGGQWSNRGVWDATVTTLSERNPFAAVMDFGDKMLSLFMKMLVPSAAAGVAGAFPGLGAINDLINNPAFVAIMIGVLVCGLVFSVVTILFIKDLVIKAVAAYFVTAAQIIVSVPLWLIGHAFPEGEGFVGQHGRKGYVMLLEVLIRPALIVTGIILTIILTSCIVQVIVQLMTMFTSAYTSFETFSAGTQLLWSVALMTMAWTSLLFVGRRLIIEFPAQVITVIGGVAMSFGSVEQSSNATVNTINGLISRTGAAIGGLGAGMGLRFGRDKGKGNGEGGNKPKTPTPGSGTVPQMAEKTDD